MALKIHHLDILDIFEYDNDQALKNQWIDKITQEDLYSIASWLMMNLRPESQTRQHKRSNIRDILRYYHDETKLFNRPAPWNDKTKWFIGHSVIDLWRERQLEQDPRYQF
jgi:hypothetical protein